MPTSFVSKGKRPLFKAVILLAAFVVTAQACIWDSDTLKDEIKKNPTLAEAILNPRPQTVDKVALTAKLSELLANRKEDDPEWWNNVAGAYLRLGQAAEAAALLGPVVSRFEDNYGIHANLGTAYHLLGRYEEAEKHIARDLELNPEAHFGLEKYHLALLQYLAKPKDYQARHLYVDEYTRAFYRVGITDSLRPTALTGPRNRHKSPEQLQTELQQITGNEMADRRKRVQLLHELAAGDEAPAYTKKHGLAEDQKFQEGVIYMASLNPNEPACIIMLGVAALNAGDLNLARKAFSRAVIMGSPMEDVLKLRIETIRFNIEEANLSSAPRRPDPIAEFLRVFVPGLVFCALLWMLVSTVRSRKGARSAVIVIAFWLSTAGIQACIWDSDSLLQEKWTSPKLADAILKPQKPLTDKKALEAKIAKLLANRQETKSEWWNELAGAYIRLGQADKAVALLEPVVSRFENDYATHANLGTAYHLLGRYAEAEKHIARDLEINPEAHHGLEKYHLALLQYLKESKEYQSRHVFVDELSLKFFNPHILFFDSPLGMEKLSREEIQKEIEASLKAKDGKDKDSGWYLMALKNLLDSPPSYKKRWNLATDEKLEEGVIYMASLNPNEPACWTMLGVVALKKRDLNLAAKAFEKAVDLDAPMKGLLQTKIEAISEHIKEAKALRLPKLLLTLIFIGIPSLLVFKLIRKLRGYRASRKQVAT